MSLELMALALAGIHFSVPLFYYLYAKAKWIPKPWNIRVNEKCRPKITVVVPTYNEAELIEEKLGNLYTQDYPEDLMEVIIVDSASGDETVKLVKKWDSEHTDVNLKILEESERRGMVDALNHALQSCAINGEIIVFTDVDASWDRDALLKIAKYFSDPEVGAVTGSIIPATPNNPIESAYRSYFNVLRIAESKIHSTPVHNGPLVAFRAALLYKIGGLRDYTGLADCTPASMIAFMGYRAIQVDDIIVRELLRGSHTRRKIRRAQHVLLSFLKTKRFAKRRGFYTRMTSFENIWRIEWWLHVANPWFLIASVSLFAGSVALHRSVISLVLLGTGLLLLISKAYRTWVVQQVYLVVATVRNLWTKDILWSK